LPNPLNFLDSNQDWRKFTTKVSDNTGAHYLDLWIENARINRKIVRNRGWIAELQDNHSGKTAVMLGASPAIKNQIATLRILQDDSDFVLIGITSGLKFMLDNGIKPKYVMIADADPDIERFWKGLDMNQTKDMTLLANICTHPKLLNMWQGPIKFIAIYTAVKKLDRKLAKWYSPVNGVGNFFPALCSQYNTGAALAYMVFGCKIIIFVGNELSFADEQTTYYADREDVKDSWERGPHMNIRGERAYTNAMLMSLKFALEDFLGKISGDGWFFNCTEAGIFGVSKRFGNLPWITQLTLTAGIMQAKSIMHTGKPILGV